MLRAAAQLQASQLVGVPWIPPGGSQGAAVTLTGSTAETILFSAVIPANSMGTLGIVRVTTLWSFVNTTANAKTPRVRLGGLAGTAFFGTTITAQTLGQYQTLIKNTGSAATQVADVISSASAYSSHNGSVITPTVNTAIDQTLAITGQLADATDSLTLHSTFIEIIKAV